MHSSAIPLASFCVKQRKRLSANYVSPDLLAFRVPLIDDGVLIIQNFYLLLQLVAL